MSIHELLEDQHDLFIQMLKKYLNLTGENLSTLTVNPPSAVDFIDDALKVLAGEVEEIKLDLAKANNCQISLKRLSRIKEDKQFFVALKTELVKKINNEIQAAKDLIAEIEQI